LYQASIQSKMAQGELLPGGPAVLVEQLHLQGAEVVEPAADQVVARLAAVPAGAAPSPTTMDALDAGLAHQALDPLARAACFEPEPQLGVDPGRAIERRDIVWMSTMVLVSTASSQSRSLQGCACHA